MKRSFFLSLILAFVCCLFAHQSARAQYAEGISAITYDSSAQMIFTYSATEVDFNTSYYYDPFVCGSLYNNVVLGMSCEGDPNEDRIAEVYLQTSTQSNQGYLLLSNHYVEGYFQVWEPTWGYYGYWDPYGYDFLPGGSYPGGYTFLPSGQTVTQYGQIYLGDTSVWLFVYPNLSAAVTGVGFSDEHPLHYFNFQPNHADPIDPNDTDLIWLSNGTRSDPAAYTKGTKPKLFASIQFSPSPPPNTYIGLRIKYNGNPVGEKLGIAVTGASLNVRDIALTADIENPDIVKKGNYTFSWEITQDGSNWSSIGNSGPHKIYWTYQNPKSPPFINKEGTEYAKLYDKALDVACTAANGESLVGTIASKVNSAVYNDIKYSPAGGASVNPLSFYISFPQGCDCGDHANLLSGLLRSIGVEATTIYIWGGNNATGQRSYYIFRDPILGPIPVTMRVTRDAHRDGIAANPHFNYHALVSAAGHLYDPSYGFVPDQIPLTESIDTATGILGVTNKVERQVFGDPTYGTVNTIICPHTN
jgi:hypothetical protein